MAPKGLLGHFSDSLGGRYRLTVYDSNGEVAVSQTEETLNSSWNLSPGTYRVEVTFNDETKKEEVTIAAGQTVHAYFKFEQRRDLKLTVSVKPDGQQGTVNVRVNDESFELEAGVQKTLSVLCSEKYVIEAYFTNDEGTYSATKTVDEPEDNQPITVSIEIGTDSGTVIETPVLRLMPTSDDEDINGVRINATIDGKTYPLSVNAWNVITDLEAGAHTVSVDYEHDGFIYTGNASFTLVAGKTVDVKFQLTSNKSEGSFDIEDEIIGNVEVEVTGLNPSYSTSSTLNATASWSGEEDLSPVWMLKEFGGEYEEIGTGTSLKYAFSNYTPGDYVLAFDLMKGNEVASRTVWLIHLFN